MRFPSHHLHYIPVHGMALPRVLGIDVDLESIVAILSSIEFAEAVTPY